MVVGWWVTEDFDSQYKVVWGETRAHGLPIHEKNQALNKNLHNYSRTLYQTGNVGVEGVTYTELLQTIYK